MSHLTNKDLELLSYGVDGLTTDEIAEKMGCSPNTIKSRKSRIFSKLDARNMAEATYKAIHQIADWRQKQDESEQDGVFFARGG